MDCKKKVGDLKYVITSHPKYTKALDHFLDSLSVVGVKNTDIIVIFGECDTSGKYIKEKFNYRPGVSYIPIQNNLYEYNFFVGVMKAIELGVCRRIDDFVLLHDTCIAGSRFVESVKDLAKSPEQIVWTNKIGCFNIGIFRYAAVKEGYNLYNKLMTLGKHDAILMEHNRHHLSPKRFVVSQKNTITSPKKATLGHFAHHDAYREGRIRTVAFIQSMDLLKFFLWVPHGDAHPNQLNG